MFSVEPSTSNFVLDEQTETMDSDTIDEMSAEMKAFMLQTIQHRQQRELKFVTIYLPPLNLKQDERASFFCFIFGKMVMQFIPQKSSILKSVNYLLQATRLVKLKRKPDRRTITFPRIKVRFLKVF